MRLWALAISSNEVLDALKPSIPTLSRAAILAVSFPREVAVGYYENERI